MIREGEATSIRSKRPARDREHDINNYLCYLPGVLGNPFGELWA